jgi:hypothetical protein
MGSQVMEVVVWVFSIVVVSTFLGIIFQVLRGVFDGYMDRWEKNYLVNKKAKYENILSVNDPLPGEEEIDDEDDWVNEKFEYEGKNKVGVQGGDYYQPVKEKPNSEQFRPPHPSDAVDDKDVQDFLEWADEPGPWSEEDDKIYTVGGLTADKDRDFMKFQDKMDERDKQLGGDSDNNVDGEKEE